MKTTTLLVCFTLLAIGALVKVQSQEAPKPAQVSTPVIEYATVRFMEEKTSIMWPDGKVDNVMALHGTTKFDNGGEKYPKGSDYRMFWLTISMNIMAQRGFELAHMHDRDVVMKRQALR